MTPAVALPRAADNAPPRPALSRRGFLKLCGGGLLAAGAAGAYARFVEPQWPTVEPVAMDFPDLPAALEGLRIAQLSDLHLSPRVPGAYLREQFERTVALSPDVIVLTGDFITRADSRYHDELTELLGVLQAPLGVYAVLGNHDWGVYQGVFPVHIGPTWADRIVKAVTAAGVRVLRNESHTIARGDAQLQLVGLEDLWSGSCDPATAFREVDPALPRFALAHNPDTIINLKEYPCRWVLSGHTHGGQVRIPFFGAPILPVVNRRFDAGLVHVGTQRLYVNRGIGHLIPIRFNCRPEITLFTLTRTA